MPDDKISELPLVPSGTPSKATDEAVVNFRNPDGSYTTMRDTFAKLKAFFSGDKENTGVAQTLVNSHESQTDPHPQYVTQSETDSKFLATIKTGGAYYQQNKVLLQNNTEIVKVPQMGKVIVIDSGAGDIQVTIDATWLTNNGLLDQSIFSVFNNNSTHVVYLDCGADTYFNKVLNTSDTFVVIQPKQSALLYREETTGNVFSFTVFLNKETSNGGGGGGIPEPTANGNWLRTNLGTWVDGVLKSAYDTFVSATNIALGQKANISGETFTGNINAANLSGINTGDETNTTIKTKLGVDLTNKVLNSDKANYDQYIEGIADKWIDAAAYKRLWDYSHVTGKAFTKNVFSKGWTSVSFQNGYSNFDGGYQTAQFRKIENNMVQFRGLIKKTTTVTAGETIFTLPLGCRPSQNLYLSAFVYDGTNVFRPAGIFILPDGTVNIGKDSSWSTMTFMSIELPPFVAARYNMTAIGDSITVGQGATTPSTGGYAPRLANYINVSLVNRGIGGVLLQNSIGNTGNGTNNIRDRYVNDVHPNQSDVIIIAGGVNDIFLNNASVTALDYKNDIKEMIGLSVQAGYNKRSIIVLTPFYVKPSQYALSAPPFNGGSVARHEAFVKAAIDAVKETGAFYIDIYTAMLNGGGDSLIGSDGVHPNDAGHIFIAQYIYDYMC